MAIPGINVALSLTAGGFLGGINKAVGGLKKMVKAMSFGAQATVGFGLAIGALAAVHINNSIKEIIKFQQQLAGLQKVMNDFDSAQLVARNIGKLSKELPITSAALFEVAESAARLGIRGTKNIVEFTKVAGMIGVATDLSAEQAADAFARILKQTGTTVDEFGVLGAVVNELSNNMATTTSEIVASVRRSAPDLARIGFTANEIAAIAATLNEVSESATRAGTRLRRFAQDLTDPRKIEAFATAIGESEDNFRGLMQSDPVQVFKRIIAVVREGGYESEQLVINLDTQVRLLLSAMATNGEGLEKAFDIVKQQLSGPDSLVKEVAIFTDTAASQMVLVQNAADEMQRRTGAALSRLTIDWQKTKLAATELLDFILHGERSPFDFVSMNEDAIERLDVLINKAMLRRAKEAGVKTLDVFDKEMPKVKEAYNTIREEVAGMASELEIFGDTALEIFAVTIPKAILDSEAGVDNLDNSIEAATTTARGIVDVLKRLGEGTNQDINSEVVRGLKTKVELIALYKRGTRDVSDPLYLTAEAIEVLAQNLVHYATAQNKADTAARNSADAKDINEAAAKAETVAVEKATEAIGKSARWIDLHSDVVLAAGDYYDKLVEAINNYHNKLARQEEEEEALKQLQETTEALAQARVEWREQGAEIAKDTLLARTRTKEQKLAVERQLEMAEAVALTTVAFGFLAPAMALVRIEELRAKFAAEDAQTAVEEAEESSEKLMRERLKRADQMQARIDKMSMNTEASQFEFLVQSLERIADSAVTAFDAIITGSGNAGEAVIQMIRSIAQELMRRQITSFLLQIFANSGGFKVGAGEGAKAMTEADVLKGPGIKKFASGGSVNAGQVAMVGERGAELFVPSTSGTVVPNDKLGGLGNSETFVINNHFTIQAMDGVSVRNALISEKKTIQGITMGGVSKSRALKKAGAF